MLEEFDINLKIIGYMLSASFFVASFAVVFIGMLSDYIGRRRVLVSLLGLSALFVGLHAFADSLLVLTILRISGFALGAGLYLVASNVLLDRASTISGVNSWHSPDRLSIRICNCLFDSCPAN